MIRIMLYTSYRLLFYHCRNKKPEMESAGGKKRVDRHSGSMFRYYLYLAAITGIQKPQGAQSQTKRTLTPRPDFKPTLQTPMQNAQYMPRAPKNTRLRKLPHIFAPAPRGLHGLEVRFAATLLPGGCRVGWRCGTVVLDDLCKGLKDVARHARCIATHVHVGVLV